MFIGQHQYLEMTSAWVSVRKADGFSCLLLWNIILGCVAFAYAVEHCLMMQIYVAFSYVAFA